MEGEGACSDLHFQELCRWEESNSLKVTQKMRLQRGVRKTSKRLTLIKLLKGQNGQNLNRSVQGKKVGGRSEV